MPYEMSSLRKDSVIALTFDDGPNEPYTRQILEVLAEYGAKATFFPIGCYIRMFPAAIRQIHELGHEIGCHTDTHPNLAVTPKDLASHEICYTTGFIHGFTSKRPKLLRPPFGNMSPEAFQIAEDVNLKVTLWDVHGHDWAADSVEEITAPIFAYLDEHKSGIVLLHDGFYKEFGADRSKTVEATRRILERYKDQKFVTVSELQNS